VENGIRTVAVRNKQGSNYCLLFTKQQVDETISAVSASGSQTTTKNFPSLPKKEKKLHGRRSQALARGVSPDPRSVLSNLFSLTIFCVSINQTWELHRWLL
jgi:hypothetical protein